MLFSKLDPWKAGGWCLSLCAKCCRNHQKLTWIQCGCLIVMPTAWGAEEGGSHKDQANQGCIGSLYLKKTKDDIYFSVVYIRALQSDTELHQQRRGGGVRYISIGSMKL